MRQRAKIQAVLRTLILRPLGSAPELASSSAMNRYGLIVLVLLTAACSGDERAVDAARPVDASVDAGIDAQDRCELLCGCMEERCQTNRSDCLATCRGLLTSVRECRIMHCGYAATSPSLHCPHARGESPVDVPECVQP